VLDERIDLSSCANNYVISTNVSRRGDKLMRIANLYDQKDAQSWESLAPKLVWERAMS
jgi:hypothetical protein